MPLLLCEKTILLDVQMWIYNLSDLHGRKYLGYVMQWDYMGMPGLRRTKRIWEPITIPDKNNIHPFYEKIGT